MPRTSVALVLGAVLLSAAAALEIVQSDEAPAALGAYSQAVKHDGVLFLSGSLGLVPATMALAGDTVEVQAEQALSNLGAVLHSGNSSFDRVLKSTILLTDVADLGAVDAIYAARFSEPGPPARVAYAVKALPFENALVEIEMIAACD